MLPMSVYPNRARTSVQHSLTLCGNCDTFITKYRGLFMATIKEIAALAGVSRGTVDRVLNDRGAVNPETAEKIRKIAKELDYKPNRAGLVLAAQKKRLKLGVILFSTGNPFFQDVLSGIDEKAEELANYNCTVITKQISFGVEAQLQTIDELLAEEVNGIAMTPYNDARIRNRINALYEQGIPVVTLNTDIENSRRLAYVGSNYTRSGATAAGLLQLMTSGTVNIGIVTGSSNILCHTERIAGFMKTLVPYRDRIHVIDTVIRTPRDQCAVFCCRRCLWRLPQCGSFGAKRFRPDHCFRSGPYHETDVGKWHDCRYYLPAAKNSGQQTAFPAVRLSDHRRDSGEGIQLYRG